MKQRNQTVFYIEHLQAGWLGGWYRRLLYRLAVGLVIGLIVWLFLGLLSGPLTGLFTGLIAGMVGILVYGLGQIKPREVLTRSWRGTKRSIVMGLVVWLVSELVGILVFGLGLGLISGLGLGLSFGLPIGLVTILVAGFSTSQLDAHLRVTPNQGIWRSARNGLVVGLLAWLIGALVVGLLIWPLTGLVYGLFIGLVFGLGFGLGPFFQHFTLRFWLWRTGSLPWNYSRFLDFAAERILLRKVGGGYIFVHRLLLEYFASLDTTPTPDAARAKK